MIIIVGNVRKSQKSFDKTIHGGIFLVYRSTKKPAVAYTFGQLVNNIK